MGGAIALGYALQHPERIERLVLVSSYGLSPRVPFHGLAAGLIRTPLVRVLPKIRSHPLVVRWALRYLVGDPRAVPPDLVADALEAAREGGSVFYAWLRTELRWGRVRTCYLDRLGELVIPVLLVHGDRDRVVPVRASQEAARRLPRARLVILRGCGHWVSRERPEVFNRVLLEFLAWAG